MRHPHHDVIVQWAADTSKVVQWRHGSELWYDDEKWNHSWNPHREYRIKPEPKPDVVLYVRAECSGFYQATSFQTTNDNLRLTFDGETNKLKSAEVLP